MRPTATTSKDTEKTDDLEARILDAALVQFERVGVKKTTIEDVARQADVDRVTVYRRIGSRDDLVRAVTAREVQKLLDELNDIPSRHETIDDVVVAVFTTVVLSWRRHPLIDRMLTLEPERLLPQFTTDGGAPFVLAVESATTLLRNTLRDRDLPVAPDLRNRVEIACRIVHSIILQPVGTIDLDSDSDLTAFARAYLVPIITAARD
ncbi:TetR/AcrR family transcriptional regulator [Nocardia spumae]|uniref:TetR/AcrR family transcriptional regulator n=1 Tax=Nocardia spumae TaxID=2887190 RepID=UPI001D1372AA|nr:helix-turn-helix domain-containing protein [Nocardia spumae]